MLLTECLICPPCLSISDSLITKAYWFIHRNLETIIMIEDGKDTKVITNRFLETRYGIYNKFLCCNLFIREFPFLLDQGIIARKLTTE